MECLSRTTLYIHIGIQRHFFPGFSTTKEAEAGAGAAAICCTFPRFPSLIETIIKFPSPLSLRPLKCTSRQYFSSFLLLAEGRRSSSNRTVKHVVHGPAALSQSWKRSVAVNADVDAVLLLLLLLLSLRICHMLLLLLSFRQVCVSVVVVAAIQAIVRAVAGFFFSNLLNTSTEASSSLPLPTQSLGQSKR